MIWTGFVSRQIRFFEELSEWIDSAQRKGINFEIPWLNYCVSVCTISDVPELFDISYVFEREAQQLLKKQV